MNIACFGDNCIDSYRETGQAFPGGNPVNVAAYVRRLGESASYLGAVGDDPNGEILLSALRRKGVDVSHVRVVPGSTAVSYVSVVGGERTFTGFDEGVMADYRPGEEDIGFICRHDLAVTGLWGRSESALEAIRRRGVPTAYDASDDPFGRIAASALPHSTLFFFSDAESDEDEIRDKLARLRALGPDVVTATRGGRGSISFDGREFYTEGIVPCEVVDTMGAGDSYIAGFLVAWLGGRPLPGCMRAGAENAAVTIGYSGAWE
ncbi:MAG: fructoselysine 6-kinase [Ruminococcaceae bacterium]|nr:fructoselysine 6-kinase [Oscillospiraceae bacterium]